MLELQGDSKGLSVGGLAVINKSMFLTVSSLHFELPIPLCNSLWFCYVKICERRGGFFGSNSRYGLSIVHLVVILQGYFFKEQNYIYSHQSA